VGYRADFATIAGWVRPGSRVLDLGCGDGDLLAYLKQERGVSGYGVEIADAHVRASIANGINVVQIDLESGLSLFEDDAFDHVILSQTLQAVRHTEQILREMLRIGSEGIVTFPNFGYWRHRWQLVLGRMPVSKSLPYQWYDTPNIHLCTVRDFEDLCGKVGAQILDELVLHEGRRVRALPNLRGSLGVFRFRRTP
jgi:methionine biosynthesis protein MetW